MKRHFQCAEQVKSASNLTKYCACHEILKLKISAETPWMLPPIERRFDDNPTIIRTHPNTKSSSRTRRFGDLTRPSLETILYCKIQHFASLPSPKMSRSDAPVTPARPPTFPNTAPATQNEYHPWSASHMKRHFQCVEQVKWPGNLTKYCACHEILKLKISAETPWMLPPIERRFDDNPTIIRTHPNTKSSSRTRRFGDLTRPSLETILYCKIQHFSLRLSPKMSRSAAPVTKSHPPTSPNTASATQNDPPTSPNTAPATQNQCHQLLYESITLRIYYFTNLWLYETITLRIHHFTNLLLNESITLRIYYFTHLLLYESMTLRIFYFTNLWLYESMTVRNYYFTNSSLYESIT